MVYIRNFENHSDYEAVKDNLILPNVSYCDDQDPIVHYNPIAIRVSGVTLNKASLSLTVGNSETLVATVRPSDASNKSVVWTSSNNNIATVDTNGLVNAVGVGNATITVTTVDGNYTAQCNVSTSAAIISVSGVMLNKDTLTLDMDESETLVATVLPSNATNKNVIWSSSNNSIATVDANGIVSAISAGNVTITVTTVDGGYTAQCAMNIENPYNGHDYINIGGVRWATKNVSASSVTDSGLYFQWGDTQGYTTAQITGGTKSFNWSGYKYSNSDGSVMTKYNDSDNKTTLDIEDDAARANMGGKWRMPTPEEINALRLAVDTAWTEDYQSSGVAGMICTVTAETIGKGETLFFPAAGFAYNSRTYYVGSSGNIWSNERLSTDIEEAYKLSVNSSAFASQSQSARYYGCPIRGVVG